MKSEQEFLQPVKYSHHSTLIARWVASENKADFFTQLKSLLHIYIFGIQSKH